MFLVDKVVVMGGYNGENVNNVSSEVLDFGDFTNEKQQCQDWSPYPHQTSGATGSFIPSQEYALICGGNWALDECYKIDDTSTTFIAKMSVGRSYAASIYISETMLWVTGGSPNMDKNTGLSSTEIINNEHALGRPGPEMPIALASHEIVAFNESVFMIIGGVRFGSKDSLYSALSFYYFEESKAWVEGPTLIEARSGHVAGFVTDTDTNEKILIVAGGYSGNYLDSVELFFEHGSNEWVPGNTDIFGNNLENSTNIFTFDSF